MRRFATYLVGVCLALWPAVASAQTSSIAGTVKDTSGAVLPGVTVEVSSPALIEKTRTAVTDGSGQYKIIELRPGTYSVTFTLPGFSTVKRDGIELTSDFTATINADMKVGAVEETITVSAESPVVDVQGITQRTVMTRDVLDALPTGRNIQAVGIMIPGTAIALGGGGALNRDVGGSGGMQQSPLIYKGSTDTIQTIEGMRLNNLCAQGAYSGVYWNDGSFQELSYVTGADSAEMGQGGVRVNMVPRDGANTFHGTVVANGTHGPWQANNYNAADLSGDKTFNPNNVLANTSVIQEVWDFNPGVGGPIVKDKAWFYGTFRYWGSNLTKPGSFPNLLNSAFKYQPDLSHPGVDDGHIYSTVGRVAWQVSQKDKITVYHDNQRKFRPHWGIAANVPPEASGNEVTPTNFVTVEKWTRTQTNKLLFDGGFSMYDQEYTELYQPSVTGQSAAVFDPAAIAASHVYTILDNSTNQYANAWNAPADHFSKLLTESFSASYVTGAHSFKFGGMVTEGRWRLVQQYTGNVQPITYNAGVPASVTLRLPTDRRNAIKADTGIYAQDRWTIGRATVNAGLRWDWFIGSTLPETLPANPLNGNQPITFNTCPDGKNNLAAGCVGTVENWKDLNPRLGVAYDVFGNGKTAVKTSIARYVNGQMIALADSANPEVTVGNTDTRAWRDLDGNGLPFDANGNLQLNELTASPATPTFGKNIPTTTTTDPAILNGWGVRGYNWEYAASAQHQIVGRWSVNGGYYIRWFGNQTFTRDTRFTAASYDSFCIATPSDPNLPNGGNYQVCGVEDLKPAVAAQNLPAANIITFASNYGSMINRFYGFDVSTVARFNNGAFIQLGVNAQRSVLDYCAVTDQLGPLSATAFSGISPVSANATTVYTPTTQSTGTEIYPDGSRACHQVFPYRPDVKLLGSYTLPLDIMISGTYQHSQGPNILANWSVNNAVVQPGLGRVLANAVTSKVVNLVEPGQVYGLSLDQLDLRASKRFKLDRYRFRVDADLYNVFNSDWPYTLTNTFTALPTSQWLRPTNVLQGRLFKIGAQFDF